MIESVACYGCEVWFLKPEEKRKLLALKMNYLRVQLECPYYKKISKSTIRSKIQAER